MHRRPTHPPKSAGPPIRHAGPPLRQAPHRGKASRGSEAKPASQERRPPTSSSPKAGPQALLFVIRHSGAPLRHSGAPLRHAGPPHFVIPAKAGIQRGGGECGKASRASEAKPACQEAGAPIVIPEKAGIPEWATVIPAPRFVTGAPLRHSGRPTSSFRRRPESRGAVRGEQVSEAATSQERRPIPLTSSAKAGIQKWGQYPVPHP